MGTRSPTGSSTDRRTSKTANLAKSSPTVLTTKCVRILKDSRRSGPIGVFVTTGASACAVNTRRRPDDAAALSVSPQRREANFKLKLQRAPFSWGNFFGLRPRLCSLPVSISHGRWRSQRLFLLPWPLYCFIVYFIARIIHWFYAFSTLSITLEKKTNYLNSFSF